MVKFQRQAEKIKHGKAQAKRREDAVPALQPQLNGSYGASKSSVSSGGPREHGPLERPHKVPRLSSGATVGAAIVEAGNSLDVDVC